MHWAVNDRCLAWSERGLIAPFSRNVLSRSAVVSLNVIKPGLTPCGREGSFSLKVTHQPDAQTNRCGPAKPCRH